MMLAELLCTRLCVRVHVEEGGELPRHTAYGHALGSRLGEMNRETHEPLSSPRNCPNSQAEPRMQAGGPNSDSDINFKSYESLSQ